jgi:hypothetical protein
MTTRSMPAAEPWKCSMPNDKLGTIRTISATSRAAARRARRDLRR